MNASGALLYVELILGWAQLQPGSLPYDATGAKNCRRASHLPGVQTSGRRVLPPQRLCGLYGPRFPRFVPAHFIETCLVPQAPLPLS